MNLEASVSHIIGSLNKFGCKYKTIYIYIWRNYLDKFVRKMCGNKQPCHSQKKYK